MVGILFRWVLRGAVLAAIAVPAPAQRFFPDDPLSSELPPLDTPAPSPRSLNSMLDYFSGTFTRPGERHPPGGVIASLGVNTLGEVMDGAWYVNRHAREPMSADALRRGAGNSRPPNQEQPWEVVTVKAQGFRTGILIQDGNGQQYLLRFDPLDHLEMSTAAGIIASRFLYALGYWTLEDYIVYFDRTQLVAAPEGADVSSLGRLRSLLEEDIDRFLASVPRDPERGYRALATRVPEGTPLGPFKFEGTRSDDPNDLFSHEHRRDLRGLFVFSAWLNNILPEATSTLDILVEEEIDGEPVQFIRHTWVDFDAALGSGSGRVKEIQESNDPTFSWETARDNFLTAGVTAPDWMTADFPGLDSVGKFECQTFDPEEWNPRYLSAPFANRLPDDEFWAAKTLMALTDGDIRAVVSTGAYTNPGAEAWVAGCLIERRDRVGRTYFAKVLPLDRFRVENGRLVFEDLGVVYGFTAPRAYEVQWARFDNLQEQAFAIAGATGFGISPEVLEAASGEYFVAQIGVEGAEPVVIDGVSQNERVDVYLRREADGITVVGVDRVWPGRVLVAPRADGPADAPSRYSDLSQHQRVLFDAFAGLYAAETRLSLSPQETWSVLSVSEKTTFDAITHALETTELTNAEGQSLGNALDLCIEVDRISGQYSGRGGDQQYRIYCELRPDALETIEASREFYRDKDNTVYHADFPLNYRQSGASPTIQFSMTEDGSRADVDVDYRDSGMPRAMWNGHLSSSNSDVRAGDNYTRHVGRWPGMEAWWLGLFGSVQVSGSPLVGLLTQPPPPDHLDLPPDRPSGARPEEVHDASQEFLTDWLQRQNFDEAMEFVSDQALRCMGQADAAEPVIVTGLDGARETFRGLLGGVTDQLGTISNLIDAIEGVEPWSVELAETLGDHAYRRAFSVFEVPDDLAETFLCDQHPALEEAANAAAARTEAGTYRGTGFRFRFGADLGGTLALLWAREDGRWQVVSYVLLRQ